MTKTRDDLKSNTSNTSLHPYKTSDLVQAGAQQFLSHGGEDGAPVDAARQALSGAEAQKI